VVAELRRGLDALAARYGDVVDVEHLCSGVMAGNAWEWRTVFSRGCEVLIRGCHGPPVAPTAMRITAVMPA
jgi:hypothetical protein